MTATKLPNPMSERQHRAYGHVPHIVMVVPRGEAVRNFVYSDTLRSLHESARVTLLSVVDDEPLKLRIGHLTDRVITLESYPVHPAASRLRSILEFAHDRWLWSAVVRNRWETYERRAKDSGKVTKWRATQLCAKALAHPRVLRRLTKLYQNITWRVRPTRQFDELFGDDRPDLVFNGSHIHGPAADLPMLVANKMGIPTAGFIFSWDNLTSRSRIVVPYDHYIVWHEAMRNELLRIYSTVPPECVHVTGSPQFDYHFQDRFRLTRDSLCRRIGIDPNRPFILYTTGIDRHFYEEYRHVEHVIQLVDKLDLSPRPQLVVRNYVKGTSNELRSMASMKWQNTVFPEVLWDKKWQTPLYEDLEIYSSLIHHATLGINAASTVTLEFLMLDKPVINLDFDPPGSSLPPWLGYSRHIYFDHFRPVAESGAVMVARSVDDMRDMITCGLTNPELQSRQRCAFVAKMFGPTLDGCSADRVASTLVNIALQASRSSATPD